MSMELINLSNETKAYLNNLRKAIEKQAEATEKLARAQKPRFVELPTTNGYITIRADKVTCVHDECDGVYVYCNSDGAFKVNESYTDVVAKVNDALGIKTAVDTL